MSQVIVRYLSIGVLSAFLTGCGADPGQVVEQVRGQVLIDGEPAQKLVLVFWHVDHMHEPFGGGVSDLEGYYDIKPHAEAIRWQTGTYVVQVNDPPQLEQFRTKIQAPLSSIYAIRETSPLRMEIQEGQNAMPNLHLKAEKDLKPSPATSRFDQDRATFGAP